MSSAQKNRFRTRSEMYPLVSTYLSSGLSRKSFCRDHGIAPSTFLYWEELYVKEGKPAMPARAISSGFIPMEVRAASAPYELEIELGEGVKLRFGSLPAVAWLKELGVGC